MASKDLNELHNINHQHYSMNFPENFNTFKPHEPVILNPESIHVFSDGNALEEEFSLVHIPLPTTPKLNPPSSSNPLDSMEMNASSIHYSSLIIPKATTTTSCSPSTQSFRVEGSSFTPPSSRVVSTTSALNNDLPLGSSSATTTTPPKTSVSNQWQSTKEDPQRKTSKANSPKTVLPPDPNSSLPSSSASTVANVPVYSLGYEPAQSALTPIQSSPPQHETPSSKYQEKNSSLSIRQREHSSEDEAVQAKQNFLISVIGCMVLILFGLGLLCSCVAFYPLLKYKASDNPKVRKYGTLGLVCFIITFSINTTVLVGMFAAVVALVAVLVFGL
ncbi:hypothetical protein C9374_007246 [Naegleria lovaniensis]|uniref:Uncharacterized protein n=1 Tax=Naegleria lovaniensis TaxID=51637 RepID=A0AA88KY56_NAELO|nr:uncharacterized protein C9374_007246 [Naegleria lovaniensis]KAG2393715.1 hypothetical protein C9374_007246 [Naegleria lovaniensis]